MVQDDPSPPTSSLMLVQIRLSACEETVCHRLWLRSGSGAEFLGFLTGVVSPPSVLYNRREELPSGWSPGNAREDKRKTRFFLCMLILFPLLFSLLPSASLSPCFPPELHPTVFPSRKSTVVSPAHRLGVTFYTTPLTTITRDVFISVNQSDWKAPLIHSSAPELFHQAFFMEKATMDTVQKDQKV